MLCTRAACALDLGEVFILTNAEVGLRPVGAIGAIGAYAPEGMWNAEGWNRCALSL